MKTLLKLYLERILIKTPTLQEIETIDDLYVASACYERELIKLFAAMNDDDNGLTTGAIISIANDVYKGLK